jgi:GTPase SAR1 family protein
MGSLLRKKGKMRWNRCKIILLGQGGAGKTALSDNICGKKHQETESTLGAVKNDLQLAGFDVNVHSGTLINERLSVYKYCPETFVADALSFAVSGMEQMRNSDEPVMLNEERKSDHPTNHNIHGEKRKSEYIDPLMQQGSEGASLVTSSRSSSPSLTPIISKYPENTVLPPNIGVFTPETIDKKIAVCEDVSISYNNGFNPKLYSRCCSNNVSENPELIISLYDFGGQGEFSVFHSFFMSKNAVYFLVFDLKLFKENRDSCMYNIKFWLDSVALHTLDKKVSVDGKHVSPIALVGAKADKISPEDYHSISTELQQRFSNHVAWAGIIEYLTSSSSDSGSENSLCFFPIDNKERSTASNLSQLLSEGVKGIENLLKMEDEIPVYWIETLQDILMKKRSVLQFSEVSTLAQNNGVICDDPEKVEVRKLLRVLHERGMLLWSDESNLADIVIIEPVEYFVKLAALIICRHLATTDDPNGIVHEKGIHKVSRALWPEDWFQMLEYGLVSQRLVYKLLLSACECDIICSKSECSVSYACSKCKLVIGCSDCGNCEGTKRCACAFAFECLICGKPLDRCECIYARMYYAGDLKNSTSYFKCFKCEKEFDCAKCKALCKYNCFIHVQKVLDLLEKAGLMLPCHISSSDSLQLPCPTPSSDSPSVLHNYVKVFLVKLYSFFFRKLLLRRYLNVNNINQFSCFLAIFPLLILFSYLVPHRRPTVLLFCIIMLKYFLSSFTVFSFRKLLLRRYLNVNNINQFIFSLLYLHKIPMVIKKKSQCLENIAICLVGYKQSTAGWKRISRLKQLFILLLHSLIELWSTLCYQRKILRSTVSYQMACLKSLLRNYLKVLLVFPTSFRMLRNYQIIFQDCCIETTSLVLRTALFSIF